MSKIYFNLSDVDKINVILKAFDRGVLSINEVREYIGFDPMENGDETTFCRLVIPKNVTENERN